MRSEQEIERKKQRRQEHRQRLSQSLRRNLSRREQQGPAEPQQGDAQGWCLREQPPSHMKLWKDLEAAQAELPLTQEKK